MDHAVVAEHVCKEYRLYPGSISRLKEALSFGRRSYHKKHLALDDVSFHVPRGRALGIIGENGAGKSTLLKIVAGVLRPTTGRVERHGTVGALLELGSGFHPDYTGRENIHLSSALMGLSRRETQANLQRICLLYTSPSPRDS